jgi:CRP/FNR family cyclic AMP-dependent transcriptional regulator
MQGSAEHPSFDVMDLLTRHNTRWTFSKYKENQIVYSQGDPADSVFYVHTGKSKLRSFPNSGRKLSLQSADQTNFAARER